MPNAAIPALAPRIRARRPHDTGLRTPLLAALLATLLTGALPFASAAAADEFDRLPDVGMLPPGTERSSPVIPEMGAHYSKPEDRPVGPVYCVHRNKIVCLEYRWSRADLEAGKSWHHLPALQNLPPVNHVTMHFEKGNRGYPEPHYALHIYFVSPEALKEIR